MKPGKELDVLVAEKVMGWSWHTECNCWAENGVPRGYSFTPSTEIESAWEVVDKLSHRNFSLHCDVGRSGSDFTAGEGWMALFHIEEGPMAYTKAPTAPLAICLAAINALGVPYTEA